MKVEYDEAEEWLCTMDKWLMNNDPQFRAPESEDSEVDENARIEFKDALQLRDVVSNLQLQLTENSRSNIRERFNNKLAKLEAALCGLRGALLPLLEDLAVAQRL